MFNEVHSLRLQIVQSIGPMRSAPKYRHDFRTWSLIGLILTKLSILMSCSDAVEFLNPQAGHAMQCGASPSEPIKALFQVKPSEDVSGKFGP